MPFQFEEVKRTKLRDINVYVSKTRLCVHNLPKSVDNTKLKDICFQALSRARGVRIPEVRNIDGMDGLIDLKNEKNGSVGILESSLFIYIFFKLYTEQSDVPLRKQSMDVLIIYSYLI